MQGRALEIAAAQASVWGQPLPPDRQVARPPASPAADRARPSATPGSRPAALSGRTDISTVQAVRTQARGLAGQSLQMNPSENIASGLETEAIPTSALIKRQLAAAVQAAMRARGLSKTQMARSMGTSRLVLNRLLDSRDTSLTLATLSAAIDALDAQLDLSIALIEPPTHFAVDPCMR